MTNDLKAFKPITSFSLQGLRPGISLFQIDIHNYSKVIMDSVIYTFWSDHYTLALSNYEYIVLNIRSSFYLYTMHDA